MRYWVYENIPRNKTRIHLASCPFCQDGRGLHGVDTQTGAWFGPFPSVDDAERLATFRGRKDNRRCLECLPEEGKSPAVGSATTIKKPKEVRKKELWDWDSEEQLSCSLRLTWRPIGRITLDESGKPRFPAVASVPGLYRLRLRTSEGHDSNYVGESDNLRRRFGNYRNPGPTQQTSLRINRLIRDVLSSGGQISMAIADEARLVAVGQAEQSDLKQKSARRLFENFAISIGGAVDVESLNR